MRFLLALLLATSAHAQALSVTMGDATITNARYLRWTILERRGAANSIQVADVALIGPRGLVQPWGAAAVITNPNGGPYPVGEEPARLLDLMRGTKWLSLAFSDLDAATTGRSVLIIDNGAPLPPMLGFVWWTANDQPSRDPVTWTLDLSVDGKTWTRVDSVRQIPPPTRGDGATRRFPSVPMLSPPTSASPIAALSCDGHPTGFAVRTGGTSYTGLRTERTTVMRGELCLGVVTLRTATSYMVHIRTANGWRSPTTSYGSRASAEAAIVAAGGK